LRVLSSFWRDDSFHDWIQLPPSFKKLQFPFLGTI
jgi:hypothetical protein